jgi:hypothetical protein
MSHPQGYISFARLNLIRKARSHLYS